MRILFLDLDTLRPDHLGCYGYHRNTSPNIDRIADDGVRFNNYYCTDAPCLPSRAALMTGRYGIHSGVVGHGGTAGDLRIEGRDRSFGDRLKFQSLPGLLRDASHYTAYIGGFGHRHAAWWFYAGFREVYDTGRGGNEGADDVTPTVIDWIERNGDRENWYLHVNYWDPHTPYRSPEEFGNPFENDPLPDWYSEETLEEHKKLPGPHSALDLSMYNGNPDPDCPRHVGELHTMDDWRRLIDGYDCGIRYMDGHIGRLLDALEKKGISFDDLAIVVTSDHGENQGELATYCEHATADNITCRIPMIIKWPGGQKGIADQGFHANIDMIPTLKDLLDLNERKNCIWDGQSYAATVTDGADTGREQVVVSQCAHTCQRSVRWGDWLYMRTWHDFYRMWPEEMLFNISEDPHEQHDLATEKPDVLAEGRERYQKWHDEMMATQPDGYTNDPLETVMAEGGPFHSRWKLKDYCKRLEETGRGEWIPKLKERHPSEF